MRNNYSDIAFGYPSNSVTALMKIKASSTNISKKVYQNLAYFMNCFFNKQFMKLNLLANFCDKQFMKSNLLANFCNKQFMKSNLLANFCNKQFMKSNLLANFCNYMIIKKASKEVLIFKVPLKTTLPSLHIANLKGCNKYADWFV